MLKKTTKINIGRFKKITYLLHFTATSNKDNLTMTEKNNNEASKKYENVTRPKNTVHLSEREWFIKKFELEVGKVNSKDMVPFSTLEKDITRRKRGEKEKHLYHEYKEPPLPKDIPDIVWNGPPLSCCFCISALENCVCKGDMVLPPRRLPIGHFWKYMRYLHNLNQNKYFSKIFSTCNLNKYINQLPEKSFGKRLQEHLEAEAVVQKQLKEMDLQRGPEFCVLRCYHYYNPPATESSTYFNLKKQLLYNYLHKPAPKIVKKKPPPEPLPATSSIADEMIDGLYRTVSTQANTNQNGEFVMGDVSHILFGYSTVYQDIEGTPYCVCSYQNRKLCKPESMVKKLENLLSISGIKKRVSQLTSNLMTSLVEIEDPGIPINTRATQDPPLDDYFESIIVPSKYKVIKEVDEEVCPCCKNFQEQQTIETERIGRDVINNYDDFESNMVDSAFNASFERRHLGFGDIDNEKIEGKLMFPQKDNPFSETTECDGIQSKVRNVNDNIELLKRDLMINKPVKKYKTVDRNKHLSAIQSESMLNEEEEAENKMDKKTKKHAPGDLKGVGIKNNQMKRLDFLESLKPCCIDNLFKRLEIKITDEKFVTKLLEVEMFRRVDRCIKKIGKQRLEKLESIANIATEVDPIIENTDNNNPVEVPKQKKSLKSSLSISLKKFSDFIKKQKSSLKSFTKKIKDAHLKSKSRNAASLEHFKVKMNKSSKKMNKAVSSFFRRRYKISSNNLKYFLSSFKRDTDKALPLAHSDAETSGHPCDGRCYALEKMPDIRDPKTSEKEVFSVQYNSTCEFNSKSNNQ